MVEPMRCALRVRWSGWFLPIVCVLAAACGASPADVTPSIQFIKVPRAGEGGPNRLEAIEGRVTGARPGQRIVLFARSGVLWWVQPLVNEPFTAVGPDATWRNSTHLGTEYAALLVTADYQPPAQTDTLPPQGGSVLVVATVKGEGPASPPTRTVTFSGYEWQVRKIPSDRGGPNDFDPANVWTDDAGALHLRIAGSPGQWTSAEVILTRSLGYGTYSFVVRDVSHLEPAAALGMFTWDDHGVEQNHRELGVEISRWGDPSSKNAQHVIQPYFVPANVVRFMVPAGRLTHSFRWQPGRVSFKTVLGALGGAASRIVAQNDFTSGVPTPGGESIRINLYVFGYASMPLKNGAEVVIEKFEYLP
jgi:hypothetical protein